MPVAHAGGLSSTPRSSAGLPVNTLEKTQTQTQSVIQQYAIQPVQNVTNHIQHKREAMKFSVYEVKQKMSTSTSKNLMKAKTI